MNRLTDIADRIVAEGAALVEAAASSDGRTAAGRTVDWWIGWVPGVDEGLDCWRACVPLKGAAPEFRAAVVI